MNERDTRIREWAYRLWEEEGYPHGRDGEHWFRAVAIVMEEDGLPEAGSEAEAVADAELAPESEATPEPATEVKPAPVATPKPKAARPKKASAESTITQAPAPAPASPGRRKRT